MSESELSADVSDELVAIVLEDVEEPNLRRVLEHLIRNDKLQQACILKDMTLGRRHCLEPLGTDYPR